MPCVEYYTHFTDRYELTTERYWLKCLVPTKADPWNNRKCFLRVSGIVSQRLHRASRGYWSRAV